MRARALVIVAACAVVAVNVVSANVREKRDTIVAIVTSDLFPGGAPSTKLFSEEFGLPAIEKLKTLGEGADAAAFRIRLAEDPKTEFALKVAKAPANGVKGGLGKYEKDAMLELAPYLKSVPRIFEEFSTPLSKSKKYSTIAMTLAGPSLDKLAVPSLANLYIPNEGFRRLFFNLVSDINLMHSKGWCHNDIRAPNVAISAVPGRQDTYYLLDFGIASQISEDPDCLNKDLSVFYATMDLLNQRWRTNPPIDPATLKKFKAAELAKDWKAMTGHITDWYSALPATASKLLTTWVPSDKFKPGPRNINFKPVNPYEPTIGNAIMPKIHH